MGAREGGEGRGGGSDNSSLGKQGRLQRLDKVLRQRISGASSWKVSQLAENENVNRYGQALTAPL